MPAPINIWDSEADLAILKTLDAATLAGAFMRRWSRYVEDYRQTEHQATESKNPATIQAGIGQTG
ncbi:transcriptional regulator domain-containing protein [Acidomonas methanolica]|uniref:transcriptional regulator domain-containing protein n=1 Tax=Acidomonas methanolica TaxID=437 RepID=UPI00211A7AF7|nr:DUF6499 domain-containing protein [Acidomonas methanolica]MCQ9156674.1 hypothetical protein [Acidomonas methanolica]